MELQHKGTYILKGIEEPIRVEKSANGFWYTDRKTYKTVYITEADVVKPVFISRNDLDIHIGDLVLYIQDLWNGGTNVSLGQVTGFKNAKVQVTFENKKSAILPYNLYVITESRIRNANKWLEEI